MVLLGSCEVGLEQGAPAWCGYKLGRKGREKNTWPFSRGHSSLHLLQQVTLPLLSQLPVHEGTRRVESQLKCSGCVVPLSQTNPKSTLNPLF